MVDVGQMAPKTAVLDPTCDTEVPFLTRWRCDPSSTGHEVPTRANGSATGDISMRRGDNDVRNPINHDVQCVDDFSSHRTGLLVDDDRDRSHLNRLVGLSGNDDRLSVKPLG